MPKFYANNLIYSAALTPSTENSLYLSSNLKSDFRTKVWRSTSNSDNVVIDLGSPEPVDSICVSDNWQDGFGFDTMTIEANATNSWGSPAFTTTLTKDDVFGIGIKEFTEQSYRFWRIVLTSTLGYCELAHLFIGKKTEITTNGFGYGYRFTTQDNVVKSTTIYGQEYIDDNGTIKEISSLSMDTMSPTELDKIFEVSDFCRTIRPFYIDFCTDAGQIFSDDDRLKGLYKMTSEPSIVHKTAGFFDVSFGLREQK